MDVHALEYLLLIAETGSLSEAAEKAHLSQPAMTLAKGCALCGGALHLYMVSAEVAYWSPISSSRGP